MATTLRKDDYQRMNTVDIWGELPEFVRNVKDERDYELLSRYISDNLALTIATTLEQGGERLPREIQRRLKTDSGVPRLSNYVVNVTPYTKGKEIGMDISVEVTPRGDVYRTERMIRNDASSRISAVMGGVVDLVHGILYTSGNIPNNGSGHPIEFQPVLNPIKVQTPLEYRV